MKPQSGQLLIRTNEGAKFSGTQGNIIGKALRCENNICYYESNFGDTDCFIWRFKDGLNKHVTWSGKHD